MKPALTYAPAPELIVTDLQEELVLLDPHTSQIYTLNEVGRTVWQTLQLGHATQSALVQALLAAYEVEEAQAAQDINRILHELLAAGLIRSA